MLELDLASNMFGRRPSFIGLWQAVIEVDPSFPRSKIIAALRWATH